MGHKKSGRRTVPPLPAAIPLAQPAQDGNPPPHNQPAPAWHGLSKPARAQPLITHRRKGRSR